VPVLYGLSPLLQEEGPHGAKGGNNPKLMTATRRSFFLQVPLKNVARKPLRNGILAAAVGLLVALFVFALLFDHTVKKGVEATTGKLGADIVVVPPEAKEMAEDFLLESKEKRFYMDEKVFGQVAELPGIDKATYHIYLDTLESQCCSIAEAQVVVFDPGRDFVINGWLDEDSVRPLKKGEIYVGSYVAEYKGLIYTTQLFGRQVKVGGRLHETGTGLDRGIFMRADDLDLTQQGVAGQFKMGNISIIFLKLKDNADPAAVERAIVEVNPAVGIMTRANIGGGIKAILKDISRIFAINIVISSVLSVLLAASAFTATTNERIREVGIMRSLGARRRDISIMFLVESLVVSFSGGLAGVAGGHILVWYLGRSFQLMTRLGGITLAPEISPSIGLLSLGLGTIVCLAGALIPVIRIARVEPLTAMRSD